jgi:5-methyltetrahydrofolate--homocysteine methyltransferase
MADYEKIMNTLIAGDIEELNKLVRSSLNRGDEAKKILNQGLIKGMEIVGERMQTNEMFIPEVFRSARCMSSAVEILKPHLRAEVGGGIGRVLIGTVKGDLHDIGKNLVILMLEGAGYEVTDLGIDVATEEFVQQLKDKKADIVALSALLTTTMPMMKETIDALVESGLRQKVKVIVGGAPITQEFANEIGADGYGSDAGAAIKIAKTLV